MFGHFQRDQAEILVEKAKRGQVSRRDFNLGMALLFGTTALGFGAGRADAQAKQLVMVNWGGDAINAYNKAYGDAFFADTGVKVLQDGSGPTEGAIQAQAESGNPTWDVVDADAFSAEALGKRGLMEEIDQSMLDKANYREGFADWKYCVSTYFFSYNIAFDQTKFDGEKPANIKDFFDVEKFPGKRTLYKWGVGVWEALLMADGVAPADLYPLDIPRAHKKLAEFKEHVVGFWGGGAESQTLLLDGEASMGIVWGTRARLIEQDSGGDIQFIYQDGVISPGTLGIVKNNPAGRDVAMQFIASASDPAKQKVIFDLLGQSPANPAADVLISDEDRRFNAMDPENAAVQVVLDMAWYEENYATALDEYLKIISA